MERLSAILHRFGFVITLALFGVALLVLYEAFKRHDISEVFAALRALAPWQLATALGLTAAGYLALCGYDYLAFIYLRHPLPVRKVALAAFIGYAFTNSVGHSVISGGSVRFRLYSVWGLTPVEISKLLLFTFATFHLGMWALQAVLFMVYPVRVGQLLHIGPVATAALGAALGATVVGYIVWTLVRKKPIRIKRLELEIPTLPVTLGQIVVVAIDVMLAAAVVYVLVPDRGGVGLGAFVAVYLVALLGGYISQVPGGLGVLEGLMILLLTPALDDAEVLGAMLVYRVIYCLLPLCLAVLLLGFFEIRKEPDVSRVAQIAARSEEWLIPNTLAALTFIAGGILLMSGATPATPGRLDRLNQLVPLAVIELAHLLATLVGLALLVLAQGLRLRLAAAFAVGAGALCVGAATSLLSGGHYAGAIFLGLLLAALVPCRRHFFRRAPLGSIWLSPQWFGAVGAALLGACIVAFVAFRGSAEHSWSSFAIDAEASRTIRSLVAVAAVGVALAVANGLRRAPLRPAPPSPEHLERAARLAAASERSIAHLALVGDKSLLFSGTGDAFIMYAACRHTWVALGDPVGPANRRQELAWDFWEHARRCGARTVVYKAHPDDVGTYLDLGLTALKLGEEARVDLKSFAPQGSLREAMSRAERDGWRLEMVPPQAVPARLDELRAVSEAWLKGRGAREPGFAEGRFDEAYLRRTPAMIVVRAGRMAAFANLWPAGGREELTVDLLRYTPDAPARIMDYVLAGTMAWGAAEGYRWFTLGMAPLPGPETKALSPFWQRVGAAAFRFGEHFESVQALREYKESFAPSWTPRYLALPGGLRMARSLRDLASLIASEPPSPR